MFEQVNFHYFYEIQRQESSVRFIVFVVNISFYLDKI